MKPLKPARQAGPDKAPYIMIDSIVSSGFMGGTMQINVGANNFVLTEAGEVVVIIETTARLRLSIAAAKELKALLDKNISIMENVAADVVQPIRTVN